MSFLASMGTGYISGKVWLWAALITCMGVAATLPDWMLYPTFVALPLLYLWSLRASTRAARIVRGEGAGVLETFDAKLEVALKVPIFLIVFWGGSGAIALFKSQMTVYLWWAAIVIFFGIWIWQRLHSEAVEEGYEDEYD